MAVEEYVLASLQNLNVIPDSQVPFGRNTHLINQAKSLKKLAYTLLYDGVAVPITHLAHKMGDVSKTQIAVEFVRHYGHFFRGVHWIDTAKSEATEADIAANGAWMVTVRRAPFLEGCLKRIVWSLVIWRRQV